MRVTKETQAEPGRPHDGHADASVDEHTVDKRTRRRRLRISLIVAASVLALLGAALGTAYLMVQNWFNEVQTVDIAPDPTLKRPEKVEVEEGEKSAINVLLLGSDSRESMTTTSGFTGFRSDAIMVAQLSPDRQHITFMSIMRDNWVTIQGVGEAKINAAFSYGGLPLAVNTIENFIGAQIDHVMIVDFQSFKGLTNSVGGVTVYNTVDFSSGSNYFPAGEVFISNGDEALGFVRERYEFADGDYQRVRNQQAFMKGLAQAILNKDTLTSPQKVLGTAAAIKPYLVVDEAFTLNRAVELGLELGEMRGDGIQFFTSPTLGTGRSDDGQSIVIPNEAELANVRAAFQAGTLYEYAAGLAPGAERPQ